MREISPFRNTVRPRLVVSRPDEFPEIGEIADPKSLTIAELAAKLGIIDPQPKPVKRSKVTMRRTSRNGKTVYVRKEE